MDDLLLNELGRSLYSLERCGPGLDDLLVPSQASSGENAGKAPAKKGSKPPVSTSILDQKLEAERVLSRWCLMLSSVVPLISTRGERGQRTIAGMAVWLQSNILMFEEQPWSVMAAEQIIAQSRVVSDVVDPPAAASDPGPVEVGSVPVVTSWCQNLGVKVAPRTVYQWVADGQVESMAAPNGRIIVRLSDVIERARVNSG